MEILIPVTAPIDDANFDNAPTLAANAKRVPDASQVVFMSFSESLLRKTELTEAAAFISECWP